MGNVTRVVVVSDTQPSADALARLIGSQDDLLVVGTAIGAQAATEILPETACDVVSIDLLPEDGDGLELAETLLDLQPGLRVVVVAGSRSGVRILQAALLGVSGWVGRDEGPGIHLAALRAVARGEGYLPADPVRDQLAAQLASPDPAHGGATRALTVRESDVLSCLANGLTRKEISEALQLSPNTVRTYVRSILRKLHVHSAPAAVALAGKTCGPGPSRGGLPE